MYRGWFTGTVTRFAYFGEETEFVTLYRKDTRNLQNGRPTQCLEFEYPLENPNN